MLRKLLAGIFCSPLLAAELLLCSPAAAQTVNVRAAHPSVDVQYLPAYVAKAKGMFRDEGLDVEPFVPEHAFGLRYVGRQVLYVDGRVRGADVDRLGSRGRAQEQLGRQERRAKDTDRKSTRLK